MAINSYPAFDANDNQVTVYNTDDPAEGGGSTLNDIVTEAGGINTVLGSKTDAAQTDETVDASQIAYIKGQLSVMKAVRDVLKNAEDSDGNAFDVNATLSGSSIVAQGKDGSDTAQALPLTTVNGNLGLRVFDQLAIQAGENSIEEVPSTDHVIGGGSVQDVQTAHISPASSGEAAIASPSSGGKLRVTSMKVQSKSQSDNKINVQILDGTGGSVLDEVPCKGYGDGAVEQAPSGYLFENTAGNGLIANLSSPSTVEEVSIRITYAEIT